MFYNLIHDGSGRYIIKLFFNGLSFAYNNNAYNFAIQHFYTDYASTLDPMHIPVMTIASQYDYICPANVFTKDRRYKNKMNWVIRNAGHCPWIVHFAQVKECFDRFLQNINVCTS